MMITIKIITDVKGREPDILTPIKEQDLVLKNVADQEIFRADPPENGWSTDALIRACDRFCHAIRWTPADVIEAYLGNVWIGSTEV